MIPSQFLGQRLTKPPAATGRMFDRYWGQYSNSRRPPLDEPRIIGFGVDTGDVAMMVTWMMPGIRTVFYARVPLGSNVLEHPSGNGFLVAHPAHLVFWVKWDGSRCDVAP
jgi:hypothetical protein